VFLAVPSMFLQFASVGALACLTLMAFMHLMLRRKLIRAAAIGARRQRFESLFQLSARPMLLLDEKGLVEEANPTFADRYPEICARLQGRPVSTLAAPPSRTPVLSSVRAALEGSQRVTEAKCMFGDDGLDVELTASPMSIEGEIVGACVTFDDITDRKRIENELQGRALHDYLTGLPNRALFQDRLDHALSRVQRTGGCIALLYIDLDRFKPVNDRLGHDVGDRVLEMVAGRLKALVRSADTVARVGGDEFAILLEHTESDSQAMIAADRVVSVLRAEMSVKENAVLIGASVGVALSDENIDGPADLVRRADLAMYEAKKRGGFQGYAYTPELEEGHDDLAERLEGDLRRAIELDELSLAYQPIIDVEGEDLIGVEALLRWKHPEFGDVFPSTFIPLAEKSSLIADIDRWVLERSCRHIVGLTASGDIGPLLLSVNLSARHFEEYDFISAISDILLRTGIDPECVQLEITETAAGGDADKVCRLKALGVKVAIDDFGSGYSSLGYLRDLDVDVLKVDRSFVLALGADPSSSAIVRTIITLAEILDLEVIIEGIEDPTQLGHLEDLGGRYVQGFLWGRPLAEERLEEVLLAGVRRLTDPPATTRVDGGGEPRDVVPYLAPLGTGTRSPGLKALGDALIE
jgi:Amt family ammonium transporter